MKQLTQCCGQCPFARKTTKEYLDTRGDNGERFAGQAAGPFLLPCHMTQGFEQWRTNPDGAPLCAGAAKFRANIGVAESLPPSLGRLPADTETVFASAAELIAHHRGITLAEAEAFLSFMPLPLLTLAAMGESRVRHVAVPSQQPEKKD